MSRSKDLTVSFMLAGDLPCALTPKKCPEAAKNTAVSLFKILPLIKPSVGKIHRIFALLFSIKNTCKYYRRFRAGYGRVFVGIVSKYVKGTVKRDGSG